MSLRICPASLGFPLLPPVPENHSSSSFLYINKRLECKNVVLESTCCSAHNTYWDTVNLLANRLLGISYLGKYFTSNKILVTTYPAVLPFSLPSTGESGCLAAGLCSETSPETLNPEGRRRNSLLPCGGPWCPLCRASAMLVFDCLSVCLSTALITLWINSIHNNSSQCPPEASIWDI